MHNNNDIQKHFQNVDIKIYEIIKDADMSDWVETRPVSEYYQRLCRNIIGQQLSTKVAKVINGRVKALLPNQRYDPKEILAIEDQTLRDQGMSWAKIKYVNDLSQKVIEGVISFDSYPEMTDEEIVKDLTQVNGIGEWTADMFLMFNMGRQDHFAYGDLGLRKALKLLYGFEDYPTKEEIDTIITRWSPYKTYGACALWRWLDNNPN